MLSVATIGLVGGGGSNAWKVSYDKTLGKITIGYGTMFYNGKYFTTNDIVEGTVTTGIGTDQIVFLGLSSVYVYLRIDNALSLPTDTTNPIKIGIQSDTSAPNSKNSNTPLIEYIPLAYVDDEATVFDLRVSFWVDNFSFLA